MNLPEVTAPGGLVVGAAPTGRRSVWRYEVPIDDQAHALALTGVPLCVASGATIRDVEFWAEHTEGAPETKRWFQVFGTGHLVPSGAVYCGTVPRIAGLVFHLYEVFPLSG